MYFTEKERLLANEAALTRSMLLSGLNSLRRAENYLKGEYYQAFFSLSIGFERMLKLIYILNYREKNNGEFPGSELRKLSHNLIKLWNEVGMHELTGIHKDIFIFLDEFAGYLRYYNLDIIMDNRGKNMDSVDALEQWADIQEKILKESGRKCIMANKQEFVNLVDSRSLTLEYNMRGELMTSYGQVIDENINNDIIQGYSVQYVFEIIRSMYNKIYEIECRDRRLPVINEFFEYFTDYWKPYQIRNKKNWLNV